MGRTVARGEIWLYEFSPPDKRRPVVVLTRNSVIHLLHNVMVAPVTSSVRGIPSEVVLDQSDGMKQICAINLDNVQTVLKARLVQRIAAVRRDKLASICRALAVATGCDSAAD